MSHGHPSTSSAQPHQHGHQPGQAGPEVDLADLLDLDGEVLQTYWGEVLDEVRAAAGPHVERVLDLGAGSGVGTIRLAEAFPAAELVAVDVSEDMLDRIRVKASHRELLHRIRLVPADLDGDWPDLGALDVTWASLSLHHLADPDRVLGEVFAATRPAGVLAVAEMAEPIRFLPDDLGIGRPGLEQRCLDLLAERRSLPELGSHWAPRLESAGFEVTSDRVVEIAVGAPYPPGTARYAELWLRRMRSGLLDDLTASDVEVFAELLDHDGPAAVARRTDLHVRGSRSLTIGRRC